MVAFAVCIAKVRWCCQFFRASHAMDDCLFLIKYKPGTNIHYVMTDLAIQKVHLLQSVHVCVWPPLWSWDAVCVVKCFWGSLRSMVPGPGVTVTPCLQCKSGCITLSSSCAFEHHCGTLAIAAITLNCASAPSRAVSTGEPWEQCLPCLCTWCNPRGNG